MNYHGDPSSPDHHPRHDATDLSHHQPLHHSPAGSGAATPTSPSAGSQHFLPSSFYSAIGGLMRRLSSDPAGQLQPAASSHSSSPHNRDMSEGSRSLDPSSPRSLAHPDYNYSHNQNYNTGHSPRVSSFPASRSNTGVHQPYGSDANGVYTPPFVRTASPLRPPPLEPLTLTGFHEETPQSARLLSTTIAEEIRIMVPERLRIEDEWKLVYSLEQDGASLATLYKKCAIHTEHRNGFVLVIRDQEGGIFGAYLSEYPHPSPHYFGTGECFLWRASILASLPRAPLSADTAQSVGRSIVIPATFPANTLHYHEADPEPLISGLSRFSGPTAHSAAHSSAASLASTPSLVSISSVASSITPTPSSQPPRPLSSPSIQFSAFPYSGVNEYFMYCENHSLSIGGGDGRYGLWLDDGLEKGVSSTCLTFGNQPLSDEGDKFGVLGVEVWVIGSRR